jgi:hypothetical protein
MSAEKDLQSLQDLCDTIDNINEFAIKSFSTIDDFEGMAQDKIQEEIDNICLKVSDKANKKLSTTRDNTVKTLREKYVSANAIVSKLESIVNANPTDLDSVISVLNSIISLYTAPYKSAIDYITTFTTMATPLISKLSEKVSKLSSLKDEIPIPDGMTANFDKLNISVESIGLDDIIA